MKKIIFLCLFATLTQADNPMQLPTRPNITPNGKAHLTALAQILQAQTPGSYLRATHMPGIRYLFFRVGPETPENLGYHVVTYVNNEDRSNPTSVFSNSSDYLPADVSLLILTHSNHSLTDKKLISDIIHCIKQGEIHCPQKNQLSITLLDPKV